MIGHIGDVELAANLVRWKRLSASSYVYLLFSLSGFDHAHFDGIEAGVLQARFFNQVNSTGGGHRTRHHAAIFHDLQEVVVGLVVEATRAPDEAACEGGAA